MNTNIVRIYSTISKLDLQIDKKYYYKRIVYLALYRIIFNQIQLINIRGYNRIFTVLMINLMKSLNKRVLSKFQKSNDVIIKEIEEEQSRILHLFNEYNTNYEPTVSNQRDVFLLNYVYNMNVHNIQTRLLSHIFEIMSLTLNILDAVWLNPFQFGCLMLFLNSIISDMFDMVIDTTNLKNELVVELENNNRKIIEVFFNNRNIIYECGKEQLYLDNITKNIHDFYDIRKDYSQSYKLNMQNDDFEGTYQKKVAWLNFIIPGKPIVIWIYTDLKCICHNLMITMIAYKDIQHKISNLGTDNLKNILLPKNNKQYKIDINRIHSHNLFTIKPLIYKPAGCLIFRIPNEIKIPSKKWITIMGASGSGKTTLCNMLLQIIKDDDKKICFVDKYCEYDYNTIRRYISNVTPHFDLFDDSIEFNIKFGVADSNSARVNSDIKKYLIEFGLHQFIDKLDTNINQTSTGEKQRFKLIRCILQDKPILFLDEMTANLDADIELKIITILKKIGVEKGKSIFHITHNVGLLRFSDYNITFKNKNVVFARTR
jgi:ABC-type lipoprotein export system ATPase subunit